MKRTNSYKGKMIFNITISAIDNFLGELKRIFEDYDEEYGFKIDAKELKVVYRNETYTMGDTHFEAKNKKISFEKASELIRNKLAVLYIADRKTFSKLTFVSKGNKLSLTSDETTFNLGVEHKVSSKYIYEISNGLAMLISLVEAYKGNLVFYSKVNNNQFLFVNFHQGEELLNIEGNETTCEKLFTDYKTETLYQQFSKNFVLKAKVSMVDKKVVSNDNLLSILLMKANQEGFRAIVEQNGVDYKLSLIIEDTTLLEVFQNHLSPKDLISYTKSNDANIQSLSWYEKKDYKKTAEVNVDNKSNVFHSIFNFNELLNSMSKKNYIVQIKQNEYNDIVLELFNTQVVKQPLVL